MGQEAAEEINREAAGGSGGGNYGWKCYEGAAAYDLTGCPPLDAFTWPIHEYDHSAGRCSVTGGYVYRGSTYADLVGHYFFADWCSGEIWSLSGDPGAPLLTSWLLEATPALSRPVTFGEDIAGELYVGDQDGRLYQLTNPTVTAITLATAATPGASRAPALVAALLLFVILTLTARSVGRARPAERPEAV